MSTNEEKKNGVINQNDQQTLGTSKLPEKNPVNLTKSEDGISNEEDQIKKDNILSPLSANEDSDAGNRNFVISGSGVIDNEGENQTAGIPQSNEEVKVLTDPTGLELPIDDNSNDVDMSRSNVKSKLPHPNSKVTGELTGQPSIKNNKEDVKYWKNREQELLSKIAELEGRVKESETAKQQGAVDQVAALRQEQLEDLSRVIQERENYKNRLEIAERELEKRCNDSSKPSDQLIQELRDQNEDLRGALTKMTTILKDKTALCVNQERKMTALNHQVESLKEVVSITKDLLNIRNMEVAHLSEDISAMESKIDVERQRHNQMLVKMDEAVKLNGELKKEYESQLKIFQHLRDNYEQKVRLLSGGECTIFEKREENANVQTTGSENDKSSTGTEISDYKKS